MSHKILMLVSSAFDPDPRVHQEAASLTQDGCHVNLICLDRDDKAKLHEVIDGIEVDRIRVRSTHGRGSGQIFFLLIFWLKAFAWARSKPFDVVH